MDSLAPRRIFCPSSPLTTADRPSLTTLLPFPLFAFVFFYSILAPLTETFNVIAAGRENRWYRYPPLPPPTFLQSPFPVLGPGEIRSVKISRDSDLPLSLFTSPAPEISPARFLLFLLLLLLLPSILAPKHLFVEKLFHLLLPSPV